MAKIKFIWRMLVLGCAIVLMFIILTPMWFDSCGGFYYTHALCNEYEKRNIEGSLCPNICLHNTIQLLSCATYWRGFRLFHHKDVDIKIDSAMFLPSDSDIDISMSFSEPIYGIKANEFTNMLTGLVEDHLGPGQHDDIVNDMLTFADANRDGKLSLAEARSLWALANLREFFTTFLFQTSSLSSRLQGFCGDMFAVDAVTNFPLYKLPSSASWHDSFLIPFYRLLLPAWPIRAKHAVSLLEFVLETDVGNSHLFYMCDTNVEAFGVSAKGDIKLVSFEHIYSQYEIDLIISRRPCVADEDCVIVPPDCTASCDLSRHRCLSPSPGVCRICAILEPYVMPHAPRPVAADLRRLFENCRHLNSSAPNFLLQYSVIVGELKSLLWRQISVTVT